VIDMQISQTYRQALASVDRTMQGVFSPELARTVCTGAALLAVASTFLAWTWSSSFPGDLTVYGYPGGNQLYTLALGLLALLLLAGAYGFPGARAAVPAGAAAAIKATAFGVFVVTGYTIYAIAFDLGGLVNVEWGGFVALGASLLLLLASRALPDDSREPAQARRLPGPVEVLIIAAVLLAALLLFVHGLRTTSAQAFIAFLAASGFAILALVRCGLSARFTEITARHRAETVLGAFAVAFLFPFTQQDETYTSIAANVMIFATVALGLNVVVGLAGLLDLGYVAFLGAGAYVGALVSGTQFSPFDIHLPFWVAAPLGAAVAATLGVIIGAPTLRLRGDYLAIVTLGFGEIFRITANNLDGSAGPDITNGPNGVPAVPDLVLFGFNFGETHQFGPFELGRFANYYLLLLLLMAFVVTIFARVNNSRVGRAWVAIREDEIAAAAMGINTFRLKLMAFALGATVAGLAGTVQAHVTTSVDPSQYVFLNSAFLLAAVVLGGMGTIPGVLLGSTLLLLIPEKLRFFAEARLFLFGLALVLMMRFRPEGLWPSRRRQLEFHEEATVPGALSASPELLAKEASG
jgi:branched-chain amino acid transport system permease protein